MDLSFSVVKIFQKIGWFISKWYKRTQKVEKCRTNRDKFNFIFSCCFRFHS